MKETRNKAIAFFTLIICFWSCSNSSSLSPKEYVKWIENPSNKLVQSKTIGNLDFTAWLTPDEYMVLRSKGSLAINQEELEQGLKQLGEELWYFNFRIKNKEGNLSPLGLGVKSEQEYQYRQGHVTFEMQKDLYLLQGQDTLKCKLYQYVPNYDVTPYIEFALAFEKGLKTEDFLFVYDDNLFKIGKVNLLFTHSILGGIPKLKTL